LKNLKDEMTSKEQGEAKQGPTKKVTDERELIERLTKQEKGKEYVDPATTFKPKLAKKTEQILKGKARNTFEALTSEPQKRKERQE